MKSLKSSLFFVAFVLLISVFAPNYAQAQDDGTMDWPCNTLNRSGISIPWCNARVQDDSLVHQFNFEPAQGSSAVPRLQYAFAGSTPSTREAILRQYALIEDRRLGSTLRQG